jgi:hypothetical protein
MFPKNHTTGFTHWNDVYGGKKVISQPKKTTKQNDNKENSRPAATTKSAIKVEETKKVSEKIDSSKKMSINITKADLQRIPESINFPQEEEYVLQYWKDEKVFENCLKQSKGKPR